MFMNINDIKDGSIIRLNDDTWVHFSGKVKAGRTVKLRILASDHLVEEQYKIPERTTDLERRLGNSKGYYPMQEANEICSCLEFFPSELSALDVDDRPKWELVIQCIKDQDNPPLPAYIQATTAPDIRRKIIPQTKLRRFYESLRLFSQYAIHEALAQSLERGSTNKLERLFEASFKHFESYQCSEVAFYDPGYHRDWYEKYQPKPKSFAKCLVARLTPTDERQNHNVGGCPPLDFTVIDYDLSLRRTPGNALFEDGRHGRTSGSGGMDLLLRNKSDHTPIIAEIKAKGDTNMFLALVQCLVYAIELTTPNQLNRLQHAYNDANDFNDVTEASKCDIYIIYQNPIVQDRVPKLLNETLAIANSLFGNPDSAVRQHVRRIAFISAELPKEGGVRFYCKPEHIIPPM